MSEMISNFFDLNYSELFFEDSFYREVQTEKMLTELDEIAKILENCKNRYEPMDETISDADFRMKVVYLTERQNFEREKTRRFSPAQVYEQAMFEAYFRDEFRLPEMGEINDSVMKNFEPFSASDFLFSEKSDIDQKLVSSVDDGNDSYGKNRKVTLKRVFDYDSSSESPVKNSKVTLKRISDSDLSSGSSAKAKRLYNQIKVDSNMDIDLRRKIRKKRKLKNK